MGKGFKGFVVGFGFAVFQITLIILTTHYGKDLTELFMLLCLLGVGVWIGFSWSLGAAMDKKEEQLEKWTTRDIL